MAKKISIQRCHCNSCGRVTVHNLIAERSVSDQEEEHGFWWTDTYEVLECRGCGTVCLKYTYDDASGDRDTSYYPPPISRRPPMWRWDLPSEIREVLDEIYRALYNDSNRLALMGARTLVDMLILEQVGDVGSFQQKLAALKDQGIIAERNADILEAALDAGSAAAHRGYKPGATELTAVMDIVENALQAVYHLGKVAARLKMSTPARAKPKNPTDS